MKIFVIDTIDIPKEEGVFRQPLWEIITELSGMGCEIHVISSDSGKLHNMYFHKLLLSKKWPFLFQAASYLFAVFGSLVIAKKYRFDIVYFRSRYARVNALLLKKLMNLRFICEVHGIEYYENKYSGNGNDIFMKMLSQINTKLQIISAKNADGIRVVTEELKDYLLSCGVDENKIGIIGNGVNINIFRPIYDENTIMELKKNYGIKENNKVVLWEGYFYPWQGVEYLITAAPLILKKKANTTFLIVGNGEMMNSWKKLVGDLKLNNKFIFTGSVPYEDVPKYINISDVCVCPEITDERNRATGGSSLKLFEYLACGKPAVIGNLKGNMEIVNKAGAGIVVDPQNIDEFSDAIIRLLINKKEAVDMGNNGRELILKEYNWKSLSGQVLKLCKKTIKDV